MKYLLISFLLIADLLSGQNAFQGTVVNKNKEPVPFCAISVKHKTTGTISNEQGFFLIKTLTPNDTLVFYCIGYKRKEVPLVVLQQQPVISLVAEGIDLSEVTVSATDERAYVILNRCRDSLFVSKERRSKVYFSLESYLGNQPVELLECFYNARFNDRAVHELQFKNGRSGLAPAGDRYFVNLNTSKVFTTFNLTEQNDHLPLAPLHLNLKKLKKIFHAGFISGLGANDSVYEIYFTPKSTKDPAFSGRAWISKRTFSLQKITLEILKTRRHPFLPLHNFEKVNWVSMHFAKSFSAPGLPLHIDFRYEISYTTLKNLLSPSSGDSLFKVKCKGLLYFFDHSKSYIPPYFNYDPAVSDYQKINLLTYNGRFWQDQSTPVLSDSIIKSLLYIRKNGTLLNFSEQADKSSKPLTEDILFEFKNPKWSAKKRLTVINSGMKHDTVLKNPAYQQSFVTDRYQLTAQIYMDLNMINDSIHHHTETVFDSQQSFYNLPVETNTNAFLNIYFDLYEIGRRKLERKIASNKYSVTQLDSLYKKTTADLEEETAEYIKKVQRGKNYKELEKYNFYVLQELVIDNLAIFQTKN